jgi:hypothetical protein
VTQQPEAGSAGTAETANQAASAPMLYPSAPAPGYMVPYPQIPPYPMYGNPFSQPPYMPVTPRTINAYCSAAMSGSSVPQLQAVVNTPDDLPPSAFPRIQDWLTELDGGGRGSDGQNFAQYSQALLENGYTRIIQLADDGKVESGAKDLAACAGMPVGIAKLLVKYAIADCARIQRQ